MIKRFLVGLAGKSKALIANNKKKSAAAAVLMAVLGYWGVSALGNNNGQPRYVLAAVERGNITVSVSGSGQVSSSNQVDVKPKVSGEVVWVGVKSGDQVKTGAMIAQLDARDAQKAVRDAEANLASAKIALAKLKKPADDLATIQAENSLTKASDDLTKSYDDGFNTVANAFLDLPGLMTGLEDVLYGDTVGAAGQSNISAYTDLVKNYNDTTETFKEDTAAQYAAARNDYEKIFAIYKSSTRFSDANAIEGLIIQTHKTAVVVAEAVKSADNLLNLTKDELTERNLNLPSLLAGHQSSLASYTQKMNGHLSALLNAKDAITNAKRAVAEKNEAWEKLKIGADDLDLAAQELVVKQRENALLDAKEKLADYYIRAPFSGTVAKLDVKKFDNVSASDTVAVMTTPQKLAEISLNEADVAQVKPGQNAKLTFDAVEGLVLAGSVAEMDVIGTENQGVVTYNVKISFDASDERVKPGMSVAADIVTSVKEDVLLVPNGALKMEGRRRYVETLVSPAAVAQAQIGNSRVFSGTPQRRQVEVGLAGDETTEIVSGLKEGDQIIVRTVNGNIAPSTTPQAPSLFGPPAGGSRNSGGGGGFRIQH